LGEEKAAGCMPLGFGSPRRAGRCVRLGVCAVTGRYSRAAKSELERCASTGGEKGCCWKYKLAGS